jgi:hypothetical protein
MATYDANLGGVARRMQDHAHMGGDRFLFELGQLLEHIHNLPDQARCDDTLVAHGCAVAFAWLLDGEAE